MPIRAPQQGEPLSARFAQELVNEVNRLSGRVLALEASIGEQDRFVRRGVVVASSVSSVSNASAITYTVQMLRSDVELTGVTPINRPTSTPDVQYIPAPVGSACLVLRMPDTDGNATLKVVVWGEVLAVAEPCPVPP